MHQQTRAGKKERPCTTSRTAVALHVPETLVPEIIEISTPPPSQLTMCCSYKSMSWLPLQSAETAQPQEQRRIVSVVAEDWFYLKNLLSLSRVHSLNTIFQWIAPDAFLAPRIQEPSYEYLFILKTTLWKTLSKGGNTLKHYNTKTDVGSL